MPIVVSDITAVTAGDIGAAANLLPRQDRRKLLEYYVATAQSFPLVAKDISANDEIVGVIVGNVHGGVGWIGHLGVQARDDREDIIRALIDGCRARLPANLVIGVENQKFRDWLEREYGFSYRDGDTYVCLRSKTQPQSDSVARQLTAADANAVRALDAAVSGEDRSHLFMPALTSGWGVFDNQGNLEGFWIPWGSGPPFAAPNAGPIIVDSKANDMKTVLALIAKQPQGEDRFYNAAVLESNQRGLSDLEKEGFDEYMVVQRLQLGDVNWRPDQIYGINSLALG